MRKVILIGLLTITSIFAEEQFNSSNKEFHKIVIEESVIQQKENAVKNATKHFQKSYKDIILKCGEEGVKSKVEEAVCKAAKKEFQDSINLLTEEIPKDKRAYCLRTIVRLMDKSSEDSLSKVSREVIFTKINNMNKNEDCVMAFKISLGK